MEIGCNTLVYTLPFLLNFVRINLGSMIGLEAFQTNPNLNFRVTKGTIVADSGWWWKWTRTKSARFTGEKGPKCPFLGQHCRPRSVPIAGVLPRPNGRSRPWPRDLSTPKKYAQSQFSSIYNKIYEPHICDWAFFNA